MGLTAVSGLKSPMVIGFITSSDLNLLFTSLLGSCSISKLNNGTVVSGCVNPDTSGVITEKVGCIFGVNFATGSNNNPPPAFRDLTKVKIFYGLPAKSARMFPVTHLNLEL